MVVDLFMSISSLRVYVNVLTIDEIHELRRAEREEIYQSLKKIVHGDRLSETVGDKVLDGISKLLELDNTTDSETVAALGYTTVKPGLDDLTTLPAMDVEEDLVNTTVPSTAVSVQADVKDFAEAEVLTANVTGEAWLILPGLVNPK
jgi:hypothetical protein